jgi:anti-sigma factor RsiW
MLCFKDTKEGAELLVDFCAGSLEPAQAGKLERHIAGCLDCRELVEEQRAVWETLDRWTAPAVSPEFNARLYARVAEEASGWRTWLPGVFRPVVPYSIWKSAALAAACAVLVFGFLAPPLDYRMSHRETEPQAEVDKGENVDIQQVANTLEELDMLTPAPASAM